jgi:predicted CXXCH cytochrome family protein
MPLPVKIALTFLLLYGLVISTTNAAGAAPDKPHEPHDFRAYGMNCRTCHLQVTMKTRGTMVKPVGEICAGCHKNTGLAHPVDMKPSFALPAGLPLDDRGMMTCATCHDPHRSAYDAFTGNKTLYLRRDGSKKSLCQTCHRNLA